ncbi:GMC oxidoreductase [Magnetospirillum moscoviense]|uniref:Glucose-methanol-choline oxidoreductase C-terminal domain-containing protein n=1 Tax=Magnetospirillum moscoviense TaxID=1437059 RepID=A0A178MX07_9PROT|nr:GMC oxidoreductase [Magnetospirillum moscoviense]OAN55063.1 hypothetical protein A6A05_00445 [Magnetospirillum moscoviense]
MSSDLPILVVGTGPASVSAAFPLVQAGLRVWMIEAGEAALPTPAADRPTLTELRTGRPGSVAHLVGHDLGGLRDMSGYSPKLRTAASPAFVDHYARANRLSVSNFELVGTLTPGGLSNIWGAACSAYDADDLSGTGLSPDDLAPSYRAVAERIGLSGCLDDEMSVIHGTALPLQPALPLGPTATQLLDTHLRTAPCSDFRLGRSRNAVLSQGLGERQPCALDMTCLWGCPRRAIYSAAYDLAELERHPNLILSRKVVVDVISAGPAGGLTVAGHHADGTPFLAQADRVLVGAGAVASTRMALEAAGRFDQPVPMGSAPAAAFALLLPSRIGQSAPQNGFGLAQMSFRLALSSQPHDYALGLLYDATTLSIADLAAQTPLSRAGAVSAISTLAPAMMVGLVYLPGEYASSTATLLRTGGGQCRMDLTGAVTAEYGPTMRRLARTLRSLFAQRGAWLLPGSFRPYQPGAEVHYGASLPMGTVTGRLGEMPGVPGLHLIDGAVLPRIPAKHHTFTVMANADRIGRGLAKTLLDA